MAGLSLYRSNRLESLVTELAGLLRRPAGNPLQPETIVVQSLGMRRWLSLQLARELRVTMNCRFPFPAGFAQQFFQAMLPSAPSIAPFTPEVLQWRIFSALPEIAARSDAPELARYLHGEQTELKQYQLSGKLARLIDQYMVQRPETLLEWQGGRTDDWQSLLWRELTHEHPNAHPPALLRLLNEQLAAGESSTSGRIPERVVFFGISHLSPYYLHLIEAAAKTTGIHFFLFEPTDAFWGDLRSRREQAALLRRTGGTAQEQHLEEGNPLLVSLGRPGRAFVSAVADLSTHGFVERFAPPARTHLLAQIQADIFEVHDGAPGDDRVIAPDDRSLQVHCCHGAMREVEVLHDHLLDLFERMPDLSPKDVLVAMPDVEQYAPAIEAVFGAPEEDRLRIPYTIADRSGRVRELIPAAFLQLLELHGSRFGAATMLDLLAIPPIRRKFGIEENQLPTIRNWLEQAGIRWGIDGEHRTQFDVPASHQNSWRHGLDRLLLGYAMPASECRLFECYLPGAEIEGSLSELLGRAIAFFEAVFERLPALSQPRSLAAWREALLGLQGTFFEESEEYSDSLHRLRRHFDHLRDLEAYHTDTISFDVIRAHLSSVISDEESGAGFLAGHVTFCALKPLRSVPFRVICLLGMNDTAFPRQDAALSFDLVAKSPRPLDRTRRDDDRQLFLETLLSARDVLYISYSGKSVRDASEAPPSVVVAELLDYLEGGYRTESDESVREAVVTHHRLQAFNPEYFTGGKRLFSYSRENAAASAQRDGSLILLSQFIDAPLPDPGPEWSSVSLRQLSTFLCQPTKFYLRNRLNVSLTEDEPALRECEPFALDALEQTRLRGEILDLLLAGRSPGEVLELLRARDCLPHGWCGDGIVQALAGDAAELHRRVRERGYTGALPPQLIDLRLGETRVLGKLDHFTDRARIRFRAAKLTIKDRLRAWVDHLVLNAAPDGAIRETHLLAMDKTVVFKPVENASDLLLDLLALYRSNLVSPVPFFPRSSCAYAEKIHKGKDPEEARYAAEKIWEGGYMISAEAEDESHRICYRGESPLGPEWEATALRVLLPLFAAQADGEGGCEE